MNVLFIAKHERFTLATLLAIIFHGNYHFALSRPWQVPQYKYLIDPTARIFLHRLVAKSERYISHKEDPVSIFTDEWPFQER